MRLRVMVWNVHGFRAGTRPIATAVTDAAPDLGLSGKERAEHARELTDLLAGREPVILGGDLNEAANEPAAMWIGDRYWDAASAAGRTFPSWEPRARIDYLFVSDGISVARAWVGGARFAGLSDHLPVLADVELER